MVSGKRYIVTMRRKYCLRPFARTLAELEHVGVHIDQGLRVSRLVVNNSVALQRAAEYSYLGHGRLLVVLKGELIIVRTH